MRTIIVEEGVTTLGGFSFYGLSNVTSVSLPSTLQEIRGEAFYACSSLPEITIPASVTTIGPYAFDRCTQLKKVTFEGDAPKVQGYSFFFDFYTSSPPFTNSSGDFYYCSDYAWTAGRMSALSSYGTWHRHRREGLRELRRPDLYPDSRQRDGHRRGRLRGMRPGEDRPGGKQILDPISAPGHAAWGLLYCAGVNGAFALEGACYPCAARGDVL